MKRKFLITIAMIMAIGIQAQNIKLVGTWKEEGVERTWIFKKDGTLSLVGSIPTQARFFGRYFNYNLWYSRTEGKWTVSGDTITEIGIPLQINIQCRNLDLNGLTAAQKKQIKDRMDQDRALEQSRLKSDWAKNYVGYKRIYTVESFSPMRMALNFNGSKFVLIRDVDKMTPAEKAAFEKDVAEYEAQIQKEKEMRELAKREAEAKAKHEADERAKRAEEARLEAEKVYWEQMGAEKRASFDKVAAEGVNLIDLGLSVRWADRNLGASSDSDKGECYAWDEITPKEDSNSKYKPIMKPKVGAVLDASSDPATVRWGTGWHVPTIEQWKELFEKCSMRENTDHTGVIFTGPNGNNITIPFTSYTYWAHYWSNSIRYKNIARIASVPRQAPAQMILGYEVKSSDTPAVGSIDVDTLLPIRAVME